jgi:ATPase family associated with various cellular activities (AAA)
MNTELETLNLVLHEELNLVHLSWSRLADAVVREGLAHLTTLHWATSAESLRAVDELTLASGSWERGECALVDLSELVERRCLAYIRLARGNFSAWIAAGERGAFADAEQLLERRFPRAVATEEHEIPVRFWANNYSRSRTIAVQPWPEIAGNYPSRVALELSRLFATDSVVAEGGRLLLWHGPPGLGKTHALRALGWEWHDWCDLDYVTDPEAFFGSAEYMLDVLLDHQDEDRWRLLVLEDTGELLSADAKARTGQGLSRFLNVVDGMLGQGLQLLVLVTTNEELRHLHGAVARPGRCAAVVEFRPFTVAEASAWLESRGIAAPQAVPASLAELFAVAEGRGVRETATTIGFAL